jgi:sulfur carrier protein
MTITVNGESRRASEGQTVRDLVVELGLGDRAVAVEVNRELVPRQQHERTVLREGDEVEVVTLVGGG